MSAPMVRWIGLLVCCSLTVRPVQAASPSLAFDIGSTAECREVVPEGDRPGFADEKIVELKLRVSVHLLAGNIEDVEEVRIEIGDCDSRIRVESFSPHTRLQSDYSQEITVTKLTEQSKTLGATLGGEAPLPLGEVVAHVLPSLSGGLANREVVTEKQVRHAPQYAVVASGTFGREHGVFFKLRGSPQTTLEGTHELTVRFVVPQKWRGDALRVCCYATGQEKFLWTHQQATWARTCSPLAVYLAGDRAARTAAEHHIQRTAL